MHPLPAQVEEAVGQPRLFRIIDLAKDRLGVGEAQPVTLTLPNLAADPLPALLLTFDTNVTDESS